MMSTANLPSYPGLPAYTEEPLYGLEQSLAHNKRAVRTRHKQDFVKKSRTGVICLRLTERGDHADAPVYGWGESVEGTIELSKTDNITSVEVKIEGTLLLIEVAEGGKTSHELCLNKRRLWSNEESTSCPPTLSFSLQLPETFSDKDGKYPLPPTYECHLSGFPGFRASIDYSVSATVNKTRSIFGLGSLTMSTSFTYFPRSRPAVSLPLSIQPMISPNDMAGLSSWRAFSSTIKAKNPGKGGKDIEAKLFLPTSRIFSLTEPIPFYLTFESSALSLATFLPYGPAAMSVSQHRHHTQMTLLRKSIVGSKTSEVLPDGLPRKPEIWSVVKIGEGTFRFFNDGPDWITFSGEVSVSKSNVKNPGFKAAGLFVRDFISLTMVPPDPIKSPFKDLRIVVPIRLTTDPYTVNSDSPPYACVPLESFEAYLDP